MKILLLIPLIIGGLLIGLGIRESNNMTQSPDVRVGGSILTILGIGFLLIVAIIYFLIFVFT
jgi:uncharacterized membrane protein